MNREAEKRRQFCLLACLSLLSRSFTDSMKAPSHTHSTLYHHCTHAHTHRGCLGPPLCWRSSSSARIWASSSAFTPFSICPRAKVPPPHPAPIAASSRPQQAPPPPLSVTPLRPQALLGFVAAFFLNQALPFPSNPHARQIQKPAPCCSRPLGARGRRIIRPHW